MNRAKTAELIILAAARKAPQRYLGLAEHIDPPPKGADRLAICWSGLEYLNTATIEGYLEDARDAWTNAAEFDLIACDLTKAAPPLSPPETKIMRESVTLATLPAGNETHQPASIGSEKDEDGV
jgi:hypothetical protein